MLMWVMNLGFAGSDVGVAPFFATQAELLGVGS